MAIGALAAILGQAAAGAVRGERRQQRTRLMSALRELAISCASERDPTAVAKLIADQACGLAGADSGFVSWADRVGGPLVRLFDSEPDAVAPVLGWVQGIAGDVLEQSGSVLIDDYPSYERAVPSSIEQGTRSMLAVPLQLTSGPSGVLGVRSHLPAHFTKSDAEALSLIAAQGAPALRLARQHAEIESRVRDLEALHEVAVAASGILDANALAQLAVDQAVRLLANTGAALRWYEEQSGGLVLKAFQSFRSVGPGTTGLGAGSLGLAFERGTPVVLNDYDSFPDRQLWALEGGIKSVAVVPLLVGSRPVGTLTVVAYEAREFTPRDVQLLELLAAQVAPALEAARHAEERERQGRALIGAQELASAVTGELDPAGVARLAAEKARELLAVEEAVVASLESPGELVILASTEPAHLGLRIPAGRFLIGEAMTRREPVQVDDYPAYGDRWEVMLAAGASSCLAVPLLTGERATGALLAYARRRRIFTDSDVRLVELLSSQVAAALEAARLHASLADSESRYRSLYETTATGIVVLDAQGRTLDANPGAAVILETSRPGLLETVPGEAGGWDRYREDGTPMPFEERPAALAIRTRKPVHLVHALRRGDRVKWIQFDAVPLLDAAGELERVVVNFSDVTAIREAEEARRETQAKDRFLASMSHELRTPLNSVLGFAQLLQEGELDPRQQRYVANIITSGRHLLDLVNDVLDLSKVAAGRLDLKIEPVSIRPLLDGVVTRVRPLAEAAHLELELVGAARPLLAADRRRLEQVIWNLLSNAIKFTPAGGRIAVRCGSSRGRGWITVADTGVGIAPQHIGVIFDEFTQVEEGRNRRHEGTGLGLALSRSLLGLMDGDIGVESTAGKGSVFKVTLPLAEAPA